MLVCDPSNQGKAALRGERLAVWEGRRRGWRKPAVERLGISERALRYKLQQYRMEGGVA